jgi:hypothetical protein
MSKVRLNNNVYNNSVPISQKDSHMVIAKTSQLGSGQNLSIVRIA